MGLSTYGAVSDAVAEAESYYRPTEKLRFLPKTTIVRECFLLNVRSVLPPVLRTKEPIIELCFEITHRSSVALAPDLHKTWEMVWLCSTRYQHAREM